MMYQLDFVVTHHDVPVLNVSARFQAKEEYEEQATKENGIKSTLKNMIKFIMDDSKEEYTKSHDVNIFEFFIRVNTLEVPAQENIPEMVAGKIVTNNILRSLEVVLNNVADKWEKIKITK